MKVQTSVVSAIVGLLVACGVRRNPEACERDEHCESGLVCNLDTNRCEMPPDSGLGCTENAHCPDTAPVCGVDQMCRGCQLDDECASGVCEQDGLCLPADRVLYVAPSGISAGACTPTTPCDLAFARTQLSQSKATIRLANGMYSLANDFLLTGASSRATIVGGSSAVLQRTTPGPVLQVEGGARLIVRGFATTRGISCADARLVVQRLVFDGATETRPWVAGFGCALSVIDSELNNSPAEGILAMGGNGGTPSVDLTGTTIRNSVGHGVRASLSSTGCFITRSHILKGMQIGISVENAELTVSRSVIAENRRGGISFMGAGTYDITNNFVFRNGNAADAEFGGLRLAPLSAGNNKVRHNTIVWNDSNVAANPSYAGGLYCTNGLAENNLVQNNFSGNTTQPNSQFAGTCATTGSIIDPGTIDMLYLSPIAVPFDYHLGSITSPAVEAATASDVTIDFDGQPRPNGKADIGADEFHL